jgi:hypothetical protein
LSKRQKSFLFILLVFLIFLLLFVFKVRDNMKDFEVNYKAGERFAVGETLYQVQDGHYMFKYLPFSAFLYVPLSFLPLDLAKLIWYSIVIFCSFYIFYLSKKILRPEGKSIYLFIFTPLVLAKFVLREIQLGQINAVVTVVLLLMILFLMNDLQQRVPTPPSNLTSEEKSRSKKEICAGVLCGLATAMKPYALIFFPYFLVKKKFMPILTGMSFLILALFIPSFFYGFRGNIILLKEWISSLSHSTPIYLTSQDNISIIALFSKWTQNQTLSLILAGAVTAVLALLVLVLVLKGRGMAQASILECSILLVLIPLISPLGWDYTLLISALGVMFAIQNFFRYSKFWRIFLAFNFFVISFSLYDLMGRKLYSEFMSWSIITINFLILIGYLAYLRLRKLY